MLPDRYPVAIWEPGPEWKQGYDFFTGYINQNLGYGVVVHSAEGSYAGAISVLRGPKYVSWTLFFPKLGPPIQHYSLNAITWHCGRYGDDGGQVAGNGCLVGCEVEGKAGEGLTQNQIDHLILFLKWYWKARGLGEPSRPDKEQTFPTRSIPLILDDELWAHNEISATKCPSGRIPWRLLIEGMVATEEPSEWEIFSRGLEVELQYFHRVRRLAQDIDIEAVYLELFWRRDASLPPIDHEVFKRVRGLCQQMMAAISDLHARCQIADRHK